ncbi:MAG: Flagellin N-methylase [Methanosaeta sp. PtaB.Bin039]|nr:MAG: Flagellin N-methylase [Methanosaeta sp. PtaB.Bin039]OPY45116.1 MAG: Flagellin N-methylase [Methanosaeta sp. PtaU1.Bin028]HOT07757.1 YkgJ family cysteine cluster protein [Methanotrichaceae archaeon]HQF16028.1 YkgJ family cysteine cluster protein [Methanotrichaceae archaeon]HQI90856.1 YkgJ family cysteine cluster protein [Methanotrichaceae archaeon]
MPRVFVRAAFGEVRFECQRCGSCCHHRRPREFDLLIPMEQIEDFVARSNLIYLTVQDISRISKKTGKSPAEFVDTLYPYRDGRFVRILREGQDVVLDLPVMRSKPDTTCIFYTEGCSVYGVRPAACRLFPFFVKENITAEGDLLLEIGVNSTCPGVGKGALVDGHELERLVADHFSSRSIAVAEEVKSLLRAGRIAPGARIFRSLPGGPRT